MLRTSFCQFTPVRKYEELAKVAEETKKNFAAYERDDLKLREVSSSLNPLCLPSNCASLLGLCDRNLSKWTYAFLVV